VDLRNQWVSFRISDIYLPDPKEVLFDLHGADQLEGKVADLSDNGPLREAFAVIEVEGLDQPVIVPVDRLSGVI
jgi:predicted ribosome quality control (RQC) complex YloA/Tae2 family protein